MEVATPDHVLAPRTVAIVAELKDETIGVQAGEPHPLVDVVLGEPVVARASSSLRSAPSFATVT